MQRTSCKSWSFLGHTWALPLGKGRWVGGSMRCAASTPKGTWILQMREHLDHTGAKGCVRECCTAMLDQKRLLWLSSSASVCFSLSSPGCLQLWTGFSWLLPSAQPRSRGGSMAKGCWPQTMTCSTWSCLCSVCPTAPCAGSLLCESTALIFSCHKRGCVCSRWSLGPTAATLTSSCAGNVCLVPRA